MTTISGMLNVAKSALITQQKAIDITGNNIANVNTPGYSRQRLTIEQNTPVRAGGQSMSTGVSANSQIQRLYDQFLNAQLNGENHALGRWEAQHEALEKVELMFDESNGYGLSSAINDLFNAWQDLSNNPSGVAERTALVSSAQYLSDSFNQVDNSLSQLREDIDGKVNNLVDQINSMTDQIAALNLKIAEVEVTGHNANDFRDERDQLVFDLSRMIDINSFQDDAGHVNISVGNGKPLVDGSSTWRLVASNSAGVQNIFWEGNDATLSDITSEISGGELKGWIETRDTLIGDYMSQIDDLASTIRTSTNAQHALGIDLNGSAGIDFFTGTGASDMALNSLIALDSDLIAAAGAGEGLPAGNGNAMAIANLQSGATMAGASTFNEYYNSLVGRIGADVQTSEFNADHQLTMVHSLKNYRLEVSGVSLDEEMVNLIQFQHAYNAAARLITQADEMLDTLMNMTR